MRLHITICANDVICILHFSCKGKMYTLPLGVNDMPSLIFSVSFLFKISSRAFLVGVFVGFILAL